MHKGYCAEKASVLDSRCLSLPWFKQLPGSLTAAVLSSSAEMCAALSCWRCCQKLEAKRVTFPFLLPSGFQCVPPTGSLTKGILEMSLVVSRTPYNITEHRKVGMEAESRETKGQAGPYLWSLSVYSQPSMHV